MNMTIKITKMSELQDALTPNNKPVGTERIGVIDALPTVGQSFRVNRVNGFFQTSTVQEILSENTFRTHNSIYKWEEIKELN